MADDAAEIKRLLTERLEGVLDRWFSGWTLHKGHAFPAYVSAKDPGSFQVYLRDCKEGRRGEWFRRSAAIGGDVINLVSYGETGSHQNYKEAFAAARVFLGWDGAREGDTEENRAARQRAEAERKQEQQRRQEEIARERELNAAEARGLWAEVRPLDGTGGEIYLSRNRKIPRPPGGWPETLGFHPALYHRFIHRRFPALVGRIQDMTDETVAVSAVFLDPETFRKIDIEGHEDKLTYGPMGGGAVRFGGTAAHVDTCEGKETGLGVWHLTNFARPVWCCLSTSGVKGLELPLEIERVTHWPDGDLAIRKNGSGGYMTVARGAGEQAGLDLGEHLTRSGISFSMNEPPGGGLKKMDFLDVFLAVQEAESHA